MATVVIQGTPTDNAVFYAFISGLATHAIAKSINTLLTGGLKYASVFAPIQIFHMTMLITLLRWNI